MHIHLYMDDPDERKAYQYLQKKKSKTRGWIAQAINAYAETAAPRTAPGPSADSADRYGEIAARLDSIDRRLDAIETNLKDRPPAAPGPKGSPSAARRNPPPERQNGGAFTDADLRAEAAQIPQDVFADMRAFTGH